MTKQTEAIALALDALESCGWNDGYNGENQYFDDLEVGNAIAALRSALANTGEALDEPSQLADANLVQERRVQQQFMDEEVLYTAPPRREWVSLTSGEQTEIIERYYDDEIDFHDFARAIEAKLKEKNHGS